MARVSRWCFTIVLLSLLAMLTACASPSTPTPLPTPQPAPDPFPADAKVYRSGDTLPATLGIGEAPKFVYGKEGGYIHQDLNLAKRLCVLEEGEMLAVEAFVDPPQSLFRILVRKSDCAGYVSESDVRIPGAGSNDSGSGVSLCDYVGAARQALTRTQDRLSEAKSHLSDSNWLGKAAQETRSEYSAFGAKRRPTGTGNLQKRTVEAIKAASKLLDAWAAGKSGEIEAGDYLRLLESATGEVNLIRRTKGCQ